MVINEKKTKEMVICFGKSSLNPIVINNKTIERVDEFKIVGVVFQSDLYWEAHIQ
jgi:hypothetical protein